MTTLICQFNIDSRVFICPVRIPERHDASFVEKLQEHGVNVLYMTKGEIVSVSPLDGGSDMASFSGVRNLYTRVVIPRVESVFRRLGQTKQQRLGLDGNDAKVAREQEHANAVLAEMQTLFNLLDYPDSVHTRNLTARLTEHANKAEHEGSAFDGTWNQIATKMAHV